MTDFRDRRVLITGAASGIGRLMALRIAEKGGRLILWDLDEAHLAEGRAARSPRQRWPASACNFSPSAPMTLRMVSKPGLRSPESAL